MNRISERISTAVVGVTCPGCEKRVRPTPAPPEPEPAAPPESGQRWSFVWRPPSGEVCPECGFPLARYAGRAKWIRLLSAGVALLTLGILLVVLGMVSELPAWLAAIRTGLVALGIVTFLAGLAGVVLGGRSQSGGS